MSSAASSPLSSAPIAIQSNTSNPCSTTKRSRTAAFFAKNAVYAVYSVHHCIRTRIDGTILSVLVKLGHRFHLDHPFRRKGALRPLRDGGGRLERGIRQRVCGLPVGLRDAAIPLPLRLWPIRRSRRRAARHYASSTANCALGYFLNSRHERRSPVQFHTSMPPSSLKWFDPWGFWRAGHPVQRNSV